MSQIVQRLQADSPTTATVWTVGLRKKIESILNFPRKYARIPESSGFSSEIRSCPYTSYRVIYEIIESRQVIYILSIYHGARKAFLPVEM